jgi:LysR family transcriptional activator of nhaA
MATLNYHHLRQFHAIAQEGSLTGAARRLNVAQSALSTQLKQLEAQLGHALFERKGRRMELTEAGRLALDHAETIFRTGAELLDTLKGQRAAMRRVLRIGAIPTLSRNFQMELLRPLIGRGDVELVVRSGPLRDLLTQLDALTLDAVLSNEAVPQDAESPWVSRLLDEQPVSLVARKARRTAPFRFPHDLRETPVLLPGRQSQIRQRFDLIMQEAGIRPLVVAEVDDMAMLRLFARESPGVTLVPPVVVRDELRAGVLVERCQVPNLAEGFYAITRSRRFPNPLLAELLGEARPLG